MASIFIQNELSRVRDKFKNNKELITCVPSLVRIELKKTMYKHLILHLQFPKEYPHQCILIEMKSKTLPPQLLQKLLILAEAEVQKILGESQVLVVYNTIKKYVFENKFLTCWEEINQIKSLFTNDTDNFSFSQKTGNIKLKLFCKKYNLFCKLKVPDSYPLEPPCVTIQKSNFHRFFLDQFTAQIAELGRNLSQGIKIRVSAGKKHTILVAQETGPGCKYPKSSLYPTVLYILEECIRRYPHEKCQYCNQSILPDSPAHQDDQITTNLERLYCSHFFHSDCLESYMMRPPFKGKLCPGCNKEVFHSKYVNTKLLEEKWAHEQARLREISEVAEFLGV